MALTTGSELGPYEIVGAIGAGGMGEVYRARDRRLKREVALKVLPDALAGDPDRVARFQREAEILATLAHPNIAAIFGLEVTAPAGTGVGPTRALVMELVAGESLADRIARGRIPTDEALALARQLVDALDYAHEHGVLHRDLKPANIKVTPDGQVKVLDFGLAKALAPGLEPTPAAAPEQTPTLASPLMTAAGVLLGTAAYMSPEQARSQPVDKRADIWAFGCVLYEMLSGTRAFEGDTISDTLAAVLRNQPDLDRLSSAVPPGVRTLLARCLHKDPKQRLRDIGDARRELDQPPASETASTIATATPPLWRLVVPWAAAAAGLVIGAISLIPRPAPQVDGAPLMRIEASVGADATIEGDIGPAAVLSPDGSLLAFVARPRDGAPHLYVRRIAELEAVELAGTDGARDPFFSPDGQWVGFQASGKLKKVPTAGGTVVTLCDASNTRGASWSEDGRIIFNPVPAGGVPLQVVSAAGGVPEPLTALGEGEVTQRWPQLIRGGQVVLYTTSRNLGRYDDGEIVAQTLPSGPRRTIVSGYFGRYVPTGHLTFVRGGRLFAATFDVERLELTGSPVPVLEQVRTGPTTGGVQFAFSNAGTAVYRVGATSARRMIWIDTKGIGPALPLAAADWSNMRFSPDGQRLALDIHDGQQTDIHVYDWALDRLTQLTFDPAEDWSSVWTPDGRAVVFRSARDRAFNLYWQRADGSGSAERLTTSPNPQIAYSWHPNGKLLAFVETFPDTGTDIMLLPVDSATGRTLGAPTVFLNTPAAEGTPSFSPDGRWIAYTSADAGRTRVWVRPFPGPGGQWLIAADGLHPTWSSRRRELLFFGPDQRVMVSTYTTEGDVFKPATARPWSPVRLHTATRGIGGGVDGLAFALHPDGDRIAGAPLADVEAETRDNRVVFLFNFFDELRRVAVRRE